MRRGHGDRFAVEPCRAFGFMKITDPAGPVGATTPPRRDLGLDHVGARVAERVRRALRRLLGRVGLQPVRARDDHQRAVQVRHLVEEDQRVHHPGLGDVVVLAVGRIVLVPEPDVAVERRLAVDAQLERVDLLAEQLLHRVEQPRVPDHVVVEVAVEVRVEHAARRAAVLLEDDAGARGTRRRGCGRARR